MTSLTQNSQEQPAQEAISELAQEEIVSNKSNDAQCAENSAASPSASSELPKEIGGRREGLEPTRYGDWEYKGRCIDF